MKSKDKNTLIQSNIITQDKGYCNLRDRDDIPCVARAKEYCESLWKIYRDYADPGFEKNFAKDFRAKFWEMYLTCSLIEVGFPVFKGKKSSKGPDICLEFEQGKVWIEAVAPGIGNTNDKVPDYNLAEKLEMTEYSWFDEDKIILRYRNSIEEKLKKYREYLNNSTIKFNQPYVIAINSSKIPHAFITVFSSPSSPVQPLIVKAVFPFGPPFVDVTEDFEFLEKTSYRDRIYNSNQSPIKTDIFLDTNYSGISGIIYSALSLEKASEGNAFGKASSKDYIFLQNPQAINKLPRGFLRNGTEYFVESGKLHCLSV